MSHVRSQIRAALGAALTGLASTGSRVHINRSIPVACKLGPELVVTIDTEPRIQDISVDGSILERSLNFDVNGYCTGAAVDDTLDQIGLEVEAALHTAGLLGGLIKDRPALQSVVMGMDQGQGVELGRIRMSYTTTTYTAPGAPDIVI